MHRDSRALYLTTDSIPKEFLDEKDRNEHPMTTRRNHFQLVETSPYHIKSCIDCSSKTIMSLDSCYASAPRSNSPKIHRTDESKH
jgi:hypothetical protein